MHYTYFKTYMKKKKKWRRERKHKRCTFEAFSPFLFVIIVNEERSFPAPVDLEAASGMRV